MGRFMLQEIEFLSFKDLVYKESGICFNLINRVILESRIEALMLELKITSVSEFYDLVSSNKSNLEVFLDRITTNLTKFFRTEPHFRILRNKILPEIAREKASNAPVRLWSAGCSTGEEPYSLAITCLESPHLEGRNIRIFASDLSLDSLVIAKEGRYNKAKLDNVPKEYLGKYFDHVGNSEYVIKSIVKQMVTFDYHNLRHIGPHQGMDVIFCRNVLIYFDSESQKLTVERFYDILGRRGYLFIGHSESLFGIDTRFCFNTVEDSVVYTKN